MRKLYLLIFCLALYSPTFSQCKNSISVERSLKEVNSRKSGVLDVKVVSGGEFLCTINIEKGSGPELIQKQEGNGNSVIRFKGLDTTQMYLVQVEFLLEDKAICKKLQKSQITFDAE
jgi:hypothetical protein